jgi:hypothetical protein
MKIIRTYTSRMEADIAKGFLKSAGITSFVSSDDQGSLDPALMHRHGAQLSVSDQDVDKATEILDQVEKAPPLEEDEAN